jgi:hypothetical protein
MSFPPPRHLYGETLATADVVKVVANPTTKQAVPPIEVDRWFRNNQQPNATAQNLMNQSANAAALYRSKEVFSGCDTIHGFQDLNSGGAGDRGRWKFAFHSGPFSHALYCVVVMRAPTAGATGNTYARLDIATNAAGTPVVATQSFVYGNEPTNGTGSINAWPMYKVIKNFIDGITPDTDYYGSFVDVDNGRILAASIFDLQSFTEHNDGYLSQSISTQSPILTADRQNVVDVANALWRRGAAHVLNWSVRDATAPISVNYTTDTNLIDNTSTAISAATPGYTLDMRNKDRLTQSSGVPVVMKAFIKAGAAQTISVKLKDSGGATIATCSTTSTTAGWVSSGAFNLPATVAKYDLMASVNVTPPTGEVHAVSIYEYET